MCWGSFAAGIAVGFLLSLAGVFIAIVAVLGWLLDEEEGLKW